MSGRSGKCIKGGRALSVAHYSLILFVILNVVRAVGYWPQIVSIYRDPGNASAVSLWTWIVFTGANATTVVHAVVGLQDLVVAAVFSVNAISCATIVALTMYKRRYHHPSVQKHNGKELIPEPCGHLDRPIVHANSLL